MTFVFAIIAMLAFVKSLIVIVDWGTTHKPVSVKQIVEWIVSVIVFVAALYFGFCI